MRIRSSATQISLVAAATTAIVALLLILHVSNSGAANVSALWSHDESGQGRQDHAGPENDSVRQNAKTGAPTVTVTVTAGAPHATPLSPAALAKQAHNESLGFGEIVYISMPHRTDRQDAMNLLAAYTNLKLRLIPGVDGDGMHEKEIPDGTPDFVHKSELGCWRAHANAWRYMLDSNLETMLVLEDDIDFDYNIHNIFERLSLAIQFNNTLRLDPPTERERHYAPYGLDWDILSAGQCLDDCNPTFGKLGFGYNDPDLPDKSLINPRFARIIKKILGEKQIGKQRAVFPSYGPLCTMAYAITRQGAMQLLLELSYVGLANSLDQEIISKLSEGKLRGYSVTPPFVAAWRVNGSRDSDNQIFRKEKPEQFKHYKSASGDGNLNGVSWNLLNSVRLKIVQERHHDVNNWLGYEQKAEQEKAAEEKRAQKAS